MAELMKGHPWSARYSRGKLRFDFPVYVEPKLDGIRAHLKVVRDAAVGNPVYVQVLSYAGKPLHNLERYAAALMPCMLTAGIEELDCEVVVNGSFADTYRYTRSSKGVPSDLGAAEVLLYMLDLPGMDAPYSARKSCLQAFERLARLPYLRTLNDVLAASEEDVERAFERYRAQGLEGAMVKLPDARYERKRTYAWYKLKPEETADGRIVDMVEAVCGKDQPELGLVAGDRLGRIGSVVLQLEDGSTAVPHGIPHDLGVEMFQHPEDFIGHWVEFKYMERDRQGGYRHPTFIRLREDKQ